MDGLFGNAHSQPSNFTIMDSSVEKKAMWLHLLIIVGTKNTVKLWQRLFMKLLCVSSYFGNFIFGCFWRQNYQNLMLQFVCFLFCLAHLALQTESIIQKITQPKWRQTKNEVTKIYDELGICPELIEFKFYAMVWAYLINVCEWKICKWPQKSKLRSAQWF